MILSPHVVLLAHAARITPTLTTAREHEPAPDADRPAVQAVPQTVPGSPTSLANLPSDLRHHGTLREEPSGTQTPAGRPRLPVGAQPVNQLRQSIPDALPAPRSTAVRPTRSSSPSAPTSIRPPGAGSRYLAQPVEVKLPSTQPLCVPHTASRPAPKVRPLDSKSFCSNTPPVRSTAALKATGCRLLQCSESVKKASHLLSCSKVRNPQTKHSPAQDT